jgi:hypothetical protein
LTEKKLGIRRPYATSSHLVKSIELLILFANTNGHVFGSGCIKKLLRSGLDNSVR